MLCLLGLGIGGIMQIIMPKLAYSAIGFAIAFFSKYKLIGILNEAK